MNAVIYVCHGSRVAEGREQAVDFIKRFMNHGLASIQEYCFLELAVPTIEEAFTRVINQGAKKIVVIPVLLLNAAHAKKDIPDEVKKAASRYPEVEVIYSSPIGVHEKMVELLVERIKETKDELNDNSMVLLVGRGSSDPDVKQDLNEIADLLKVNIGVRSVEACFLSVSSPSFDAGLKKAGAGNYEKVFIIPYLLFTGILMKHITRVIETHPFRDKYVLCNSLGYHRCIEEILAEKVSSLLNSQRM